MSDRTAPPPPPAPPPVDAADALAQAKRFPCPSCGARMGFDPGANLLVCSHCGAEAEVEKDAASAGPWGASAALKEQDYRAALRGAETQLEMEETATHPCAACGAQVEFDAATQADHCPFCAAPIVGQPGLTRQIKPQGVIPFGQAEPKAREAMSRWLGRLWFAPSGLTKFARKGRTLEGVYLPYWTYDAATRSRYAGQRGTYYYVNRRNSKGETVTERRIRWRPVRGRVARAFDDVLCIGSRSLEARMLRDLAPWDLTRLAAYAPGYLAGLRAETYQVTLEQGFADARAQMEQTIRLDVERDIGGDQQQIIQVDTEFDGVTFKHILLPVWIAVYRYKGKAYQVLINGQTGKVTGRRPYSPWKIALAVLAALLALGALAYGIALSEQG